ncbi:hypothetical protein F5B18DRAFT_245011 [Nemania serpens]|nr:hypothetical protein F5B18DRAFT_245011 [Nemania serpens]
MMQGRLFSAVPSLCFPRPAVAVEAWARHVALSSSTTTAVVYTGKCIHGPSYRPVVQHIMALQFVRRVCLDSIHLDTPYELCRLIIELHGAFRDPSELLGCDRGRGYTCSWYHIPLSSFYLLIHFFPP